jgi:hypothetical protein
MALENRFRAILAIVHHLRSSSTDPENIPDAKLLRKRKQGSTYDRLNLYRPRIHTDFRKSSAKQINGLREKILNIIEYFSL